MVKGHKSFEFCKKQKQYMKGLLHRTALGKRTEHFKTSFILSTAGGLCTRFGTRRHNKQLADIRNEQILDINRHTALNLILQYSKLPADIARRDTVKLF